MREAADRGIGFDICLISNVRLGAVPSAIAGVLCDDEAKIALHALGESYDWSSTATAPMLSAT
jgi:hypothetical protein